MGKKRAYIQGQVENPLSSIYGNESVLAKMPEMPKLTDEQLNEIDAEVAQQKEIEKQVGDYEAQVQQQEEQKKLEPKDGVEQVLFDKGDTPNLKTLKGIKEEMSKLESLNVVKQADKNSSFSGNTGLTPLSTGLNFMKPFYWLADALTPDTAGMGKDKQKYKDLIKERRKIETPIAIEKLKEVNAQLEVYKQKAAARSTPENKAKSIEIAKMGGWLTSVDPDDFSGAATADMLEQQKEILEKYINNEDGVLSGLGTMSKEYPTLGLNSLINSFNVSATVKKVRAEKPLSDTENDLLKAYNTQQQVESLDLSKNRFLYRTGQGTGQSVVFAEQMIATGPVEALGGAATKAVVTPLAERIGLKILLGDMGTQLTKTQLAKLAAIKYVEKGLIGTGELLAQATATPMTYQNTANKYIGQTQLVTDSEGNEKILVSKSARVAFEKEAANTIVILQQKEKELDNKVNKSAEDNARLFDIRNQIDKVKSDLNQIYDPNTGDIQKDISADDALIYGYTESLKELGSEKYVGEIGDKMFKPLTRLAEKTPGLKQLSKAYGRGAELINDTAIGKIGSNVAGHTGAAKIFHGLPGEVLEEISTQLTPTYTEDYQKQLQELANPSFYMDVVAQTLLMGGGFTALGTGKHALDYTTSPEYRKQYKENKESKKEIKQLYKNIDKAVTDEQLAQHIVMNTGNTLFEVDDYQAKIAKLRTDGKNEEADKLEKKSFSNLAVKAMQTGTLDTFERSLERIKTNQDLSEQTRNNIPAALAVVKELSHVQEKHGDKPNYETIAQLAAQKVLNKQTSTQLQERLNAIKFEGKEEFEAYNKARGLEDYQSVDSLIDSVEGGLLDIEQNNNYVRHINNLVKDNIGNINEYLQLRDFKKKFDEVDFQNTIELSRQTNPYNQEYFQEEANKKKEKVAVQTIKNAQTADQVDAVVEDAVKTNIATEGLVATAENKKSQIAATEVITEVNPNFQEPAPVVEPEIERTPEGTKEQDEDDKAGDDLLSKMLSSGLLNSGGPEEFSPREFQAQKVTPQQQKALVDLHTRIADKLDKELDKEAQFEDFINDRIAKTSYDNVDTMFKAYEYAWNAIGRDTSNAGEIYDNIYNLDTLSETMLSGFLAPDDVITQTNLAVTSAIVDNSKTVSYDKDNRPVEKDGNYSEKFQTATPQSKAAYLGVQYKDVPNSDGTLSKLPVLAQLNESEQMDNHFVLDYDAVKEGTALEVVVPDNVNSFKVADWEFKDNTWVKSEITFGNWIKKYNVEPGSVQYNNKLPMVAQLDGQAVFYVHDTDWYNTSNIAPVETQREIIKKGKLENQELRQNILAGNNKIVISERKFGSLFKLNKLESDNKPISLTEATGDTKIVVASKFDELQDSTGVVNAKLVNNLDANKFQVGQIYEIRTVNTGEQIALPVITNDAHKQEDINDVAYNNIKHSIIASVLLNGGNNPILNSELESQYGMTLSKAKEIQKQIRATTRLDIQFEIGEYMNMFVTVDSMNSRMVDKLENNSVNSATGRTKFPINTNYISVDKNVIKIVNKDGNPVARNEKGYDSLPGINLGNITERSIPYVLQILEKNFKGNDGLFRKTHFDISKSQLNKNRPFVQISETGSIVPYENKHGENTYEGYIKDSVKTNIKSFEIQGKDGKSKWITDVQPMIYFRTAQASQVAPTLTMQEQIQEAAMETAQELNEQDNPTLQKAITAIPDALKEEAMRILKGMEINDDDVNFYSRFEFTPEQIAELDKIQSNQISSLSPIQQKVLTNSLFNLVLSDISTKGGTVNLADIVAKIDSSVDSYLQPEIDKIKDTVANLTALNNTDMLPLIDRFNEKIEQLETVVKEKNKIISNGLGTTPKGDLYKKFERFLAEELTGSEDVIADDNGEVEYSFNMSALEKDVKLTFSNNLKIFFAGINRQKPRTRENITNFAYLNDYIDVDDVIQSLVEVMVGLPSSVEDLISILETKKDVPVYNQILNKINNSSEEIQNEILYKMIQSKLDMQMVLYAYNRDTNTYSLRIINPNSSSSDIKLQQQWQTNFRNSDLFKTINEERVYNKQTVQSLIERIEALRADTMTQPDVSEILSELGIDVNANTVTALIEKEGFNITTSSGILGVFKSTLRDIMNSPDNRNTENITLEKSENNPYENAKGVVESLIDLEIELNGTRVAKSFRVGSKSIQGAIQKMMVYDIKEQLKDVNSPYHLALSQIPLSKRNYILELLKTNDKFRTYYDVSFVSLEAIKQVKQKVYDDRKINKLATTDNMLTQYAFFQNTLRKLGEVIPGSDLKFRMGHMFNPALSDKEQMVLYSTALLDLDYKDFNEIDNNVVLSDEVLNFVTDQIYAAEFDRIVSTYNTPTNIKNYDGAAKRFLSIPELNNMRAENGATIHDIISKGSKDLDTMAAIRDKFRDQAKDIIAAVIHTDVLSKVNTTTNKGSWYDAGFVKREETKELSINFFDSKYLKSKKGANTTLSTDKTAQIAAYDFVVNQYLNQNNTYQLIAGDMALYAPSVKKFTNKETGEIDNVGFSKAIGESISKRMAMLIAPGNKLANSKEDKYVQIFVNDPVKMTSTAREFITQYYGSVSENNEVLLTKLNETENSIQALYETRNTNEDFEDQLDALDSTRSKILSTLADTNSEISGYFQIEGTDAQEYTTWKEHIDVLFRQGRLTTEERTTVQSAYNKLLAGEELDKKELAVVMNPLKPVYSGNVIFNDAEGKPNVNRTMYIKSSSFPLLPQMTKDFKLDAVRRQMESLEEKTGKNVRLSFQTANKVGAVNTKLTVNDLYNIPFDELYNSNKLTESSLVLDRNNFKIQQDTPYKTAKFIKKNQDDMTTMGSQMWKIILGNGINKIENKIFPNVFGEGLLQTINNRLADEDKIVSTDGMVSGRDLDKIKFHAESMYFDIQKELLYDELGLNRDTRRPVDTNETIKLLHALLDRETTTRQYPEGIIDNLELTYTQGELEFMLPIWLSNGSNKFESLMQAIITNRLIQINLPGNQHISSSSEGFEKVTADADLDSKVKSQVVWLDPNHTGELKATVVDGTLKESEVLLQSKFRKTTIGTDGKKKTELIDLTKEPYSTMQNGILVLNQDMIDDELLSNFSFRIPTSSHQSGAILRVVGFLPEASGDMLVVPKEHTQQLGEDFDIDKRTVYKSNYEVQDNGKISKLQYSENNSSLDRLMASMFEDEYLPHLTSEEGKSKFASLKGRTKMLENAMVDIYKSVYSSPDINIQKKINKILSFDNATQTANLINDRLNSSVDNTYFTPYSDDYQRDQMKLGADGKTGIGGHSNAVTFQAQMERLENKLKIQDTITVDGEISGYAPRVVVIGPYVSDGTLGEIGTLDGERNIGDVHTENQNSSTDNIKAQIMGKRNENPYTMNVLIQLTFRGFDMANFTKRDTNNPSSVQLPSLFISQPILRRYVELKEQNKSITSEFDSNAEQTIIGKLIQEFGQGIKVSRDEQGNFNRTEFMNEVDYQLASARMTGDALYDNLINQEDLKTWDGGIQLATLQKFFRLEEEAKHLGKYQSLINLSTSGLGISYFNVLERIQGINDMGYEEEISNVKDLVGKFIHKDDFQENPPVDKNDYTLVGDFYIKPTTTEGTVLIQSVSSAEDIMDINFPYKQQFITDYIDSIIENKGKDLGKKQKMDLQYRVVSSMKDYLYSTNNIGLFQGDVSAERERLFFDRDDNESLASYMNNLKVSKRYPLMYTNELLKALQFDGIQTTGAPSIIKHQTDFNTNFDKTDKYNSFMELIQDDKTDLGTFNGEPMTPRKLAQDLASYAYLANNENGAIGFRDFVNVKYLTAAGVSENIRNINRSRAGWNISNLMENFIKQFYQHNPEEARIFSPVNTNIEEFAMVNLEANKERNRYNASKEEINKIRFFNELTEFSLRDNAYQFIAMRDTSIKLSDNQYKLFQWDGDKYVQIPVLGTFGFNEYNPNNSNQKSIIYPEVGKDTTVVNNSGAIQATPALVLDQVLDLSKGITSLMEQLYNSPNSKYREFAEQLTPYIDNTTKVKIEAVMTSKGDLSTGVYRKTDNTIYLNPNLISELMMKKGINADNLNSVVEEILLEEIIHSITISQLDKYGTMTDDVYTPGENTPVFIDKLVALHNIAKQKLPNEYYTKNLYEFTAGVFVSEDFTNTLDNIMHNGKTLLDHFKDAIASMIRFITGSTYSDATRNTVFELLSNTNINVQTIEVNEIQEMKQEDFSIDNFLNKFNSGTFETGGPQEEFSGREFYSKDGDKFDFEIYDGINGKIDNPEQRSNKDKLSLSVKREGQTVGTVSFWKDTDGKYYSNNIFINQNFRRKGIASALYKYAQEIGLEIKPSKIQTEMGEKFSQSRLPEIKKC